MDGITPIACRLGPVDLTDRTADWRAVLTEGLVSGEVLAEGGRLRLRSTVEGDVRRLVALEAECCDWFTGTVRRDGDEVVLDLTAAGDGAAALVSMVDGFTAGAW